MTTTLATGIQKKFVFIAVLTHFVAPGNGVFIFVGIVACQARARQLRIGREGQNPAGHRSRSRLSATKEQ
jgi:hypothetical protein